MDSQKLTCVSDRRKSPRVYYQNKAGLLSWYWRHGDFMPWQPAELHDASHKGVAVLVSSEYHPTVGKDFELMCRETDQRVKCFTLWIGPTVKNKEDGERILLGTVLIPKTLICS